MHREAPAQLVELGREFPVIEHDYAGARQPLYNGEQRLETAGPVTKIGLEIKSGLRCLRKPIALRIRVSIATSKPSA